MLRAGIWWPGNLTARMFCGQMRLVEQMIDGTSGAEVTDYDEVHVDGAAFREFVAAAFAFMSHTGSDDLTKLVSGFLRLALRLDERLHGNWLEVPARFADIAASARDVAR